MTNDNMKVVCSTCMTPVRMPYDTRHKRNCEPGDHSEIGIEPDEEDDEPAADRHGRTVGDKREHPLCRVCERDVFAVSLSAHKARCKRGDESDVAVVEDGVDPTCEYCQEKTEPDEYIEHMRACGISDNGSDLGLSESGRINE